jgi:hypothetical protein
MKIRKSARCPRGTLAALGAGLLLQAMALPLVAHDRHDDDSVKVVASGLLSPRGLDFSASGELYVAESGVDPECGPPASTFPNCYNPTGRISRVDPWGVYGRRTVVAGLPVLGDVGPADIAFFGERGYALLGGGVASNLRQTLANTVGSNALRLGTVIRFNRHGDTAHVADVVTVETDRNPDGGVLDSDPFGLLALPGRQVVSDAGGNYLVEFAANGTSKLLAVFPPELAGGVPRDRVPSRVTQGPDGYIYVGEEAFGAGPGQARVYRVPPTGCFPINACEVYVNGLFAIMDLEFDRDGNLYVLEFAFGDILKFDRNKNRTTVYAGLSGPGGMALAHDAIYVSNRTQCFGTIRGAPFPGAAPSCAADASGKAQFGEVLRIPLPDDDDDGHGYGHR